MHEILSYCLMLLIQLEVACNASARFTSEVSVYREKEGGTQVSFAKEPYKRDFLSEKESKVRAHFGKEKPIYFQDLRVWGGLGFRTDKITLFFC